MTQPNKNVFENKEQLFLPKSALNEDFCDRLVEKIHKNLLGENISNDIYESYFFIFDQQYTTQELEYIVEVLEKQGKEMLRSKFYYAAMSGIGLFILTFIALFINSKLATAITGLQIGFIAIISFILTAFSISLLVEKEYKKVNDVLNLITYYLNFYK